MKRMLLLACVVTLATSSALAAGYDKTEKTKLYTLRLRVPEPALAIPALNAEIMARWKTDSEGLKSEAAEDKDADPDFNPFMLDTEWRVTFEDARLISMSANSFIDENGAHPNGAFDTIVWDKQASRAVPLIALFAKDKAQAALKAIAASAKASFLKWLTKEEGSPADPSQADDGIADEPGKLGHYALTHAKGGTKANGIVLLWGAGEVWPHVIGDVRLSIPASVFRADLAPEWKTQFE